jgi:hypothetical protein
MRSSKQAMLDQQRALEPEVLALLRDLHEHAPHLARLLALVEPTKSIYGCLGQQRDPTTTLARGLQASGTSAIETCHSIAQPAGGFSVYSSRVQPLWQVQGGIPHATGPLSD